jgi:hypothetical protein
MQVPDGTDWLEYMLYLPSKPTEDLQTSRISEVRIGRLTAIDSVFPLTFDLNRVNLWSNVD